MTGELASWWSSPVTAVLLAVAAWALLVALAAGSAALVRLGAIQLAGLLAQRPRLLGARAVPSEGFTWLAIVAGAATFTASAATALTVARAAARWGGAPVLGVLSGLVAVVAAAMIAAAVARGWRVEPLATAMLFCLRPGVALAARVIAANPPVAPEADGDDAGGDVDEHEVEAFIGAGEEAGILEREDAEMIASIVDFGDTVVREIMTPRTDLVAVPTDAPFSAVTRAFAESLFTRIVVFRDSLDRVEGVIHVKDVLKASVDGRSPAVSEFLRPVLVIPETKPLRDVLREFQATHQQLAVVVDEYGGTSGIVTLEDVLEEIVGEIGDEHQRETPDYTAEGEGVFVVTGAAHVEVLDELFDVEVGDEGFDSVAGLVLNCLGHLPKLGEKVTWRGLEFEVVEVDRRRLRGVRVSRSAGRPE